MPPRRYLTRREIAELLGVKHTTITGYEERGLLPEPEVLLGRAKGWSEETIVEWNAARPGRGARRDKDGAAAAERAARLELNRALTEANLTKAAERRAASGAGRSGDVTR